MKQQKAKAAGYVPSPEQVAKCRRCRYWQRLDAANLSCCHYILENRHSRGVDPCDKFEPRRGNE